MVEPILSVRTELLIKKSRFIAELMPCTDQKEVRKIISDQKIRYSDANHVVYAFILGPHAEISGMSDAGEPPGTAGRPVLDVLRGRDCTQTLLTVTRYFGGILLGTGGLVKAYSDSAKFVIEKACSTDSFRPLLDWKPFIYTIPYPCYEKTKHLLSELTVCDISENFDTDVTVRGRISNTQFETLVTQIRDISSVKVEVTGW